MEDVLNPKSLRILELSSKFTIWEEAQKKVLLRDALLQIAKMCETKLEAAALTAFMLKYLIK